MYDLTYNNAEIVIRQVNLDEKELLHQIFILRVICRNEFGVITIEKYPQGWIDDMDFYSEHFAAIYKNKIIAAGRVTFFDNISLHPYRAAIEHCLPESIKNKPIAYLSRDQVLKEFRGIGLRRILLDEREISCRGKQVTDLFIDVVDIGTQQSNFAKEGYSDVGCFKTENISWDLGPSILMHKILI